MAPRCSVINFTRRYKWCRVERTSPVNESHYYRWFLPDQWHTYADETRQGNSVFRTNDTLMQMKHGRAKLSYGPWHTYAGETRQGNSVFRTMTHLYRWNMTGEFCLPDHDSLLQMKHDMGIMSSDHYTLMQMKHHNGILSPGPWHTYAELSRSGSRQDLAPKAWVQPQFLQHRNSIVVAVAQTGPRFIETI